MEKEEEDKNQLVFIIFMLICVILFTSIMSIFLFRLSSPFKSIDANTVGLERIYTFNRFENTFIEKVTVYTNTEIKDMSVSEKENIEDISSPPALPLYGLFTISFSYMPRDSVEQLPFDYVSNIIVDFKLKKDILTDKDIDLMVWNPRYKEWVKNSAELQKEDQENVYFRANSRYFGLFAIVGRRNL